MKARKSKKRLRQRNQDVAARKPIQADLLKRAISWIVDDATFANVALHGNVTWKPTQLVSLAILWVWSSSSRLTGAFEEAKRLSEVMFGTVAVRSYQGMMKALIRYTELLKEVLWPRMHQLMETSGESCWRIGVWLALAVDGSRISTPRTESNERAFASKTFGKSSKARSRKKWRNKRRRSKPLTPIKPQIWLTLLWHMGMKMPWAWRLGPSTSSERNHLCEMLRTLKLPAKTLIAPMLALWATTSGERFFNAATSS